MQINARYYNLIGGKVEKVTYKVYLGANDVKDYNILRNGLYTYDVSIKSLTDATVITDSRVDVEHEFFFAVSDTTMDAHSDYRLLELNLGGKGVVRVSVTDTDGTPVSKGHWLQLSDNLYNRAVNPNLLTNELTTTYTSGGKKIIYLYVDNAVSNTGKPTVRKGNIKVTYTPYEEADLDDPKLSVTGIQTIAQFPPERLGLFGRDALGNRIMLYTESIVEGKAMTWCDSSNPYYTAQFSKTNFGTTFESWISDGKGATIAGAAAGIRAATICLEKNRDLNANGKIDADEVIWFTPAAEQAFALYIANNALLNPGSTDKETKYFTMNDDKAGGVLSFFANSEYGMITSFNSRKGVSTVYTNVGLVRCVRNN